MPNNAGLSPKGPTKYTGPNTYVEQVVTRNRAPTTADYLQPETGKYYPFAGLWLVGKNPTTGVYGDLWYLANIVANSANWIKFSSGGSGPLLNITVPNGVSPIVPNGSGVVAFTSTGGTVTITGVGTNTINFDLSGGSVAADTFAGDSGTAVPTSVGLVNLLGQNVSGSGIQTSATLNTVSYRMFSPYTLSEFEFIRSVVGSNQFINVINTDNTNALSGSLVQVRSGGASGGNAWFAAAIPTVGAYGWGIDNSDGNWKLTNSNTFVTAGATLLRVTNVGTTSVLAGDFDVTRSNAAGNVDVLVNNTSNTIGSTASVQIKNASVADTYLRVGIGADRSYALGLDYSDSKDFKITVSPAYDATPSSANVLFKLTGAGVPSMPLAPWTQDGVLYADAANVIASTSAGTSGQVLTSNGAGVAPTFQTVTPPTYTTGVFTPVLAFGGGSTGITYFIQNGQYTRIGNLVYIGITLFLTNKGSSTGNATITGLPFAAGTGVNIVWAPVNVTFDAGYNVAVAATAAASSEILLQQTGSALPNIALDNTNFANNSVINVYGIYFV